jgi:hypothetical protein
MTAFKWALAHLGLTQREAAEYLGVSVPAIEAWARAAKKGDWTATPPLEAWEKLRALALRQREAAKSGQDGDPWPAPGAAAMPTVLKWIASGTAPTQPGRRNAANTAKSDHLAASGKVTAASKRNN